MKVFMGHTLEWVLELAQTTYNQREEEAQKKKEKYQAKEVDGPKDGRSTVRRNRPGRRARPLRKESACHLPKGTYFLSQAKMKKCQMLLLHPR